MPNSLAPGFIKIEYTSPYAPHVMILPVNTITVPADPINSTIKAWDTTDKAWDDMAEELATEMAAAYATTVNFARITLFKQDAPEDDPIPVVTKAIDIDGTVAVPGWYQATQLTIVGRTADYGIAKLSLMDFASGGLFTKTTSLTGSGLETLVAEWEDDSNGWCGRDGAQVTTFVSATRTLNEKLRRNYHLT